LPLPNLSIEYSITSATLLHLSTAVHNENQYRQLQGLSQYSP